MSVYQVLKEPNSVVRVVELLGLLTHSRCFCTAHSSISILCRKENLINIIKVKGKEQDGCLAFLVGKVESKQ